MIKFDERFENMEHYLWNVYICYTGRFADSCREHPETAGKTFEEIKDTCPELYQAYRDVFDFLDYTEKFLNYGLNEERNYFEYKEKDGN